MFQFLKRWWGHRPLRDEVNEFAHLAAEATDPTNPRPDAARRLSRYGAVAVPPLRIALRSHSPQVRAAAAQGLRDLRRDAIEAVPDLLPLLQDTEGEVRLRRAHALASLAPRRLDIARAVIPVLLPSLRSPDASARARVLLSLLELAAEPEPLWRAGDLLEPMVKALATALEDPNAEVRRRAAWCIGRLGIDASAAVGSLVRGMTHANPRVLEVAADAACIISQQRTEAEALARSLAHPDPAERREATERLNGGNPAIAKWAVRLMLEELSQSANRAAVLEMVNGLDLSLPVIQEGIRATCRHGSSPPLLIEILRATNKYHLILEG